MKKQWARLSRRASMSRYTQYRYLLAGGCGNYFGCRLRVLFVGRKRCAGSQAAGGGALDASGASGLFLRLLANLFEPGPKRLQAIAAFEGYSRAVIAASKNGVARRLGNKCGVPISFDGRIERGQRRVDRGRCATALAVCHSFRCGSLLAAYRLAGWNVRQSDVVSAALARRSACRH